MSKPAFRLECPDGRPYLTRFFCGEEDITAALGVSEFVFRVSAGRDRAEIQLTLVDAEVRALGFLPKMSRECLEALAEANGYTVSPIADGEDHE